MNLTISRIRNALASSETKKRAKDFLWAAILFHLPKKTRKKLYAGTSHHCPICKSNLNTFLPLHRDYHLWCPICRSLQRHRLIWLFIQEKTGILDSTKKQLLHIAPEPALAEKFQRLTQIDYLSADLFDPNAMVKMDICNIQYPEQSFDIIYCSHVLEHVPDDLKAMREFKRILKPNGKAIILVPITAQETYGDPSITDPIERERLFGQIDHVRRYGTDFVERLRDSGFVVDVYKTEDLVTDGERVQMGLESGEQIFYCSLPIA